MTTPHHTPTLSEDEERAAFKLAYKDKYSLEPAMLDAAPSMANTIYQGWLLAKADERTRSKEAVEGEPSEQDIERVAEELCDAYHNFPGYWAETIPMALSGPQLHERWVRVAKAAILSYLKKD